MSDKPRLKDSDEILSSLGRGAKSTDPATAFSLSVSAEPAPERAVSPPRRRGRPPKHRDSEAEAAPEREDRNPLDFGKYDLAASRAAAAEAAAAPTPDSEPPRPRRARASSTRTSKPAEREAPAQEPAYTAYEFPRMTREELEQEAAQQPEIKEYSFQEFEDTPSSKPEPEPKSKPKAASKPKASAKSEAAAPKTTTSRKMAKTPPNPPKAKETEEEKRARLLVDEKSRDSFMEELSKKFEESFSQRFGIEEEPPPAGEPKQALPELPGFWEDSDPEDEGLSFDGDDDTLDPEAEEFVNQFLEATHREEESRSQEFKDTLARKFMRERERYLKELGIAAARDEERRRAEEAVFEEPEPETPRRRLDFQIQPEMHRSAEEQQGPVTYNRAGKMRMPDLEDVADEHSDSLREQHAPSFPPMPGGKKSSEELLLELAAQTKAAEERLFRQPSSAGMALQPPTARRQAPAPARPVSEVLTETRQRRGFPWRVVIPSTVAGLLVLVVGLLYFSGNLPFFDIVQPEGEQSQSAVVEGDDDTLTVYESRDFSAERQAYKDVLVKRSGVGVTNLSVANLLVISDVETAGKVSLSDVSVDGAIHLKNCAVEELDLSNVQTPRIIINNGQTPVTLRISGNTDIGAVELKTGASLEQSGLSEDALGVRSILVDAGGGSVSASLNGLSLPTLTTMGEAILQFGDTRVGTMTADGSISIDGTGKIVNLAVGGEAQTEIASYKPLDWAATLQPMALASSANLRPLQVVIKGVAVSTMNLKSPGDLNITTDIDTMAAADSLSITGSGTVGSLTINERFGNARLQIDLSGVKVLAMTTEAEVRVNAGGSSKINELTCNASTYALGNKVNTLRVNNDRVIYENEPDSIIVGTGNRPPETMAENPNLDYNLSTGQTGLPNTEEDDVSTTCGHTREAGGFLQGDGGKANPYVVFTAAQLAHVSSHLESYFIQTADVDIAEDSNFSGGFSMIAAAGTPFSGEYDGNGHTIKNLTITGDKDRMGLFAENTGVLRNVQIFSGSITSNLTAGAYVGGIAGINFEKGQIVACSNRARVSAKESAYVGGIAGYNYGGRVHDCYNAAKISGTANVGGLVGVNRDSGSISGSYNVGTIEGDTATGAIAGTNEAKITNCYYLEETAEYGIGEGDGSVVVCTSEDLQSAQIVDDLAAGNDTSLWTRGSTSEGAYNYPILQVPPSEE